MTSSSPPPHPIPLKPQLRIVVITLFLLLTTHSPTYADNACELQYPPSEIDNHFVCEVNMSTGEWWHPFEYCDKENGWGVNLSTCIGLPSEHNACAGATTCCLPCIFEDDEAIIILRSEPCGPGIEGECENGTTCVDNICAQNHVVGEDILCYHQQECIPPLVCKDPNESDTNTLKSCTMEGSDTFCIGDSNCDYPDYICDTTAHICVDDPSYPPPPTDPIAFDLCKQAGPLQAQCEVCVGTQDSPKHAMWTAIGCIPTSNQGLASALIKFGVAIAGGLAILLILFGAFTVTTSASNPQRLQVGREIVTAAIIGLVFIVLSVVILQYLGVEILQIPGF